MAERNIRLLLEYDGTDLSGWQRQDGSPTVQGHLEDALEKLILERTTTWGASRTDAGVHARGQVASFRTEKTLPVHSIRRGLNNFLPPSIAVLEATEMPDEFHPRFSCTGKEYRYLVLSRPDRSPRWRTRTWHRRARLDIEAMTEAASHLIGEHDFAAFRSKDCTAAHTMRRLDAVRISRPYEETPDVIAIDVRGNAFLRNMVRIVAGTLVHVGDGRLTPAQVAEILASKDRVNAGATAPAHGLELVQVFYEGRRPLPRRPKPRPDAEALPAADAGPHERV
jgi:tRNA pseudouridine38-40 synthase